MLAAEFPKGLLRWLEIFRAHSSHLWSCLQHAYFASSGLGGSDVDSDVAWVSPREAVSSVAFLGQFYASLNHESNTTWSDQGAKDRDFNVLHGAG